MIRTTEIKRAAHWRAPAQRIETIVTEPELDFIDIEHCAGGAPWRIARRLRKANADADGPGIVWLGGFASDMSSTKASYLDAWARERGRAFLRFDYSGHGASSGRFEDGCIGDWLAQTTAAFERSTEGPQIIVGSSMGGWLALLLAQRLAEKGDGPRLAGLVLLAPAVDFTEELIWANLDEAQRREIMEKGIWRRASQYSADPTPITRRLIEEGRKHLLFGTPLRSHAPVHILQGMADPDVPWRQAMKLVEHLSADPVTLTFVNDGDHRLSRDEDLARLGAVVAAMSAQETQAQRDFFAR
jgi:pimeloyl-ACP methyl ester carboxylesterase